MKKINFLEKFNDELINVIINFPTIYPQVMDYFDISVLSINFLLFLNRYISKKTQLYLICLSSLIFLAQFITVGFKWQYILLYFVSFIHILKYTYVFKERNIIVRTFLYGSLLFTFFISSALIYYLPIPRFEIKNKIYSVGYQEIFIENKDRKQPKSFYELSNLSPDTNRELLADIYYPTNQETEFIQLFKDSSSDWGVAIINYLNRTWDLNLPEFLLSHLNLTYFDIGIDVPIADNNFPVVIYTHGWAGEKIFASDQLVELASQGYVVVALDHTGLAMFTDLPSGTINNRGGTDDSSNIYEVMFEMSLDIEDTVNYLLDKNYKADFTNISVIGHSTGGGSGYIYCERNQCESLILQDPFFTPLIESNINIHLTVDTYFIYSEDWYIGYEEEGSLTEMDVLQNYITSSTPLLKYYMSDSKHYDFVAFGAISPLAKYSFLKGSIDYKDSLNVNNYFNLSSLRKEKINENQFLKVIP